MSNREKIIVGLMLLTVAYGIYALFFEGKGKSSTTPTAVVSATRQLEDLNAFITKVADASKAGLSKKDQYIIQVAETEWKQDPLISADGLQYSPGTGTWAPVAEIRPAGRLDTAWGRPSKLAGTRRLP